MTVECPAAALEGRRWLGGDITPLGEHRCELRTSDDRLDWLAMRIAMIPSPTPSTSRPRSSNAYG